MASSNHNAVTTGAQQDEAELRRRNVQSYQGANGGHVYKLEAEDKKKLRKKVRDLADEQQRRWADMTRTLASSTSSTNTSTSSHPSSS